MPTALLEPIAAPPLDSIPHKKWTRAEISELTSMGWFAGERYELIDGELINKMGKGEPHALAGMFMLAWLVPIFGFDRVRKEEPIDVAVEDNKYNEPEPDFVVLREPVQKLRMRRPQPQDVIFVIEVADSSLGVDRSKKADLYARAGIPDYWVLDVNQRQVVVHREPVGGQYTSVIAYSQDESVSPLASPQSEFRVAAVFGE
jgi:Uma2 family endonuclease